MLPDEAQADTAITIFIDADACPVKDEVYKVAQRYKVKVFVVANAAMMVPKTPAIERILVAEGPDVADDWIAERAKSGGIVITADVPLAARCIKTGAAVIAPYGKAFTPQSIGDALATRNLMDSLRSSGEVTGGPKPFTPRDRSAFLSALDLAISRLQRHGYRGAQSWV
ncbi:YaiI/YqxD family protein [Beijerinckia sp. L45]|uniref:YaiI/YqxD family protein n=1 Tax=Beijerinckia sp. L45 TaxID=1641855 RepID=UPI00131B9CC1|nr:YaiI/YqxD family protein [Beijerinckia sp. L45]